MIDIELIRENPEKVKETIKKKFQEKKIDLVNNAKNKDEEWRKLKQEIDSLRAKRNKLSQEINKLKKEGKNADKVLKEVKGIPDKISKIEDKAENLKSEIRNILINLPNEMNDAVPIGKDDSENVELKKIGEPEEKNFEVKSHGEIAEELGIADFDSSARVAGNGFYYLEGDLALLNQALIRYGIETMTARGFRYVETPLMLREEIIDQVTDLNDKEQQIYLIKDEPMALIGTSEHSLIGRFAGQTINDSKLPIKNTSYSMCFRKEIGSHGIDEKGIFRTHQFNKIEMVVICRPEESMQFFQDMQDITVDIFKNLEIPVRVLGICSGDLGDLKHIQVDIEAWSPRKKEYFEVGSCSNLTSAQARKLNIKASKGGEKYIPHTLNNTAIATSRALVAIIENFQQKDGSIKIPKVLQPYMNGKKVIKKDG